MRIGKPVIHLFKDIIHTERATFIHTWIQTYTLLPTVICGRKKDLKVSHFCILLKTEFNLLDIHNATVLCYEMPFFCFCFYPYNFDKYENRLVLSFRNDDDPMKHYCETNHLLTFHIYSLLSTEKKEKEKKRLKRIKWFKKKNKLQLMYSLLVYSECLSVTGCRGGGGTFQATVTVQIC